MKHPSSAKVFEFVEKMEKAAGRCVGKRCNMLTPMVNPECGTPGCHAGWGAIALDAIALRFTSGVVAINQHFGFEANDASVSSVARSPIEQWARNYPEIWGNDFGFEMFCDEKSFAQPKHIFPVQVLIDHWRGVGERLKAIEEAQPLETGEAK